MITPENAVLEARATAARLILRGTQSPLGPDLAIELAQAALDGGCEVEALATVNAAADQHPENGSLWQWKALLHRALDDHSAALEAFYRCNRLTPGDALITHSVARTLLEAGLPASGLFEDALELAPNNAEILLGRAAARCADGQMGLAIDELDSILSEHPLWIGGHELAARLRWLSGAPADFVETLERALVIHPGEPELWRCLLNLLVHADRYEETLGAAARARTKIGDHLVIVANEATALSELGRNADAAALFKAMGSTVDITVAVRFIRHLLRLGRIEEAAHEAEAWIEDPMANLVWPYLSVAWRLLGDKRWDWFEGDPSFIRDVDLTSLAPPADQLADVLRMIHQDLHQPLDQSLRRGTQTDGMLFQRIEPEIRALRSAIAEAVHDYISDLPAFDARHPLLCHRRDRPVRFNGSWSVRLSGGYHANHNHPMGWLSSAFYVTLPDIEPDEPLQAGWLNFGLPQAELKLHLDPIRTVEPKNGHLVLFPSTMWHGTLPFGKGERMTVAFDVAPPWPK